jgi:hypothetical protein
VELDGAGRQKAMPARSAPALDAGERKLDEAVPEERDEPLDGPAERRLAGAPAHRFAKGDFLDDLRKGRGEKSERGLAGLAARAGEVFPFGRFDRAKLGDFAAELAGECLGRTRGFAFAIEGGRHGRAGELFGQIGLPLGDAPDEERQPSRRADGPNVAMRDAKLAEALLGQAGQRRESARHEGRGQFLDADLEEQVVAHLACKLLAGV